MIVTFYEYSHEARRWIEQSVPNVKGLNYIRESAYLELKVISAGRYEWHEEFYPVCRVKVGHY